MNIRLLKPGELKETLELIRSVFLEFEAPEYSAKGTKTFMDFAGQSNIEEGIEKGELVFWVCEDEGKIVGTLAIRNCNHICMLFVDKQYHRRGIAKRLLGEGLKAADQSAVITVNSSPYAVPFYHAVGFCDTDETKTLNGITFIPMSASQIEIFKNI